MLCCAVLQVMEYYSALMSLGHTMSLEDASVIFSLVDTNGNNSISESEFIDHYVQNY